MCRDAGAYTGADAGAHDPNVTAEMMDLLNQAASGGQEDQDEEEGDEGGGHRFNQEGPQWHDAQ
jgi:hypothetical protein